MGILNMGKIEENKQTFIVLFLFVILMTFILVLLDIPEVSAENPHALYMLSALAQSLAAILALVFTISLVFAQIFAKYSYHMVLKFFDKDSKEYMALFLITILGSLILMAYPKPILVRFALILCSACLLALPHYFDSLLRKLNPAAMITAWTYEAEKQLTLDSSKVPTNVPEIMEFLGNCIEVKDYLSLDKAIKSIATVALKAEELKTKSNPSLESRVSTSLMWELKDFCIKNMGDTFGVSQIINEITTLGRKGIELKNSNLDVPSVKAIGTIGMQGAREGLWSTTDRALRSIHTLALDVLHAKYQESYILIRTSEYISAIALKAIEFQNTEILSLATVELTILSTQALSIDSYEDMVVAICEYLENLYTQCANTNLSQMSMEIMASLRTIEEAAEKRGFQKVEQIIRDILNRFALDHMLRI